MTGLLASMQDFAASRAVEFDPTDLSAIVALEGASGLVRAYTGQSFDLVEDDEVRLSGTGKDALLLPELPVLAVSEIATVADDDTETEVEADTYRLDTETGIIWRLASGTWPEGRGNLAVTYDHGYVLPGETGSNLPAEIQLVTMQVAGRLYQSAGSGAGRTVRAETIGSYSVTYAEAGMSEDGASGLLPLERAVLDRYRLVSVA